MCSACFVKEFHSHSSFATHHLARIYPKVAKSSRETANAIKSSGSLGGNVPDAIIQLIVSFGAYMFIDEHFSVSARRSQNQMILDALQDQKHTKIKQMISTLKFIVSKEQPMEFAKILVAMQPWMSILDVYSIEQQFNKVDEDLSTGQKIALLLHFATDCHVDKGLQRCALRHL